MTHRSSCFHRISWLRLKACIIFILKPISFHFGLSARRSIVLTVKGVGAQQSDPKHKMGKSRS